MADDIVIGIGADLGPLEEQANKTNEEILKISDNAEKAAEIINRGFNQSTNSIDSLNQKVEQTFKSFTNLKAAVDFVRENLSFKNLSGQQREALLDFQGSVFKPINDALRGEKKLTAEIAKNVVLITSAINNIKTPENITTFRGTKVPSNVKSGDILDLQGFTSTTLNKDVASRLAEGLAVSVGREMGEGIQRGLQAALLNVRIPAGTRAGFLSNLTGEITPERELEGELEVLLQKGLKARVVNVSEPIKVGKDQFRELTVEIINDNEKIIASEEKLQSTLKLAIADEQARFQERLKINKALIPSGVEPPSGGPPSGGSPSGGSFNTGGIAASRQEMVALAVATANVDKEIERLTSDITKTGKEKIPIATEEEIDKITIAIRNRNNEELQGFTEPRFARIIALIGAQEKAFQNFGEAVRKAGEEEVKNAQAALVINEKKLEQESKKQDAIDKAIERQKRLGEAEEKQRVRSDILTRADIERQQRQGVAPGITAGFGAGFNVPTDAGIAGVTRFQNALVGLQTAITRSTAPLSQIQDLLNRIKADPLTVSVQQLDPALQKVGATGLNVVRIIQSLHTQFQQTGQAGILAGTGIDTAFQRVESAFVRSIVFRTTGLISQGFREARATLSTTEDAARATADAINAFGLSAREQSRVSDVLFKTVQDGGIQFKELEGTIGRAGFTAHAIGLSLEETTAAIATLARDGVKASEAMTFLNNVLNQLIRPTETTKEFLKELGFNTGEEA